MSVELFSPKNKHEQVAERDFLDGLSSNKISIDSPFCDQRVEALNDIANKLMRSPIAAGAPQVLALGFWLRKSAIKQIHRDLLPQLPNCYSVPRGLAFHLPPANVDTLFAYSWALSFLAGNKNVVRLPSAMNPVAEHLVTTIIEVLREHELADSQLFVFFEKTSSLVKDISASSDLLTGYR